MRSAGSRIDCGVFCVHLDNIGQHRTTNTTDAFRRGTEKASIALRVENSQYLFV